MGPRLLALLLALSACRTEPPRAAPPAVARPASPTPEDAPPEPPTADEPPAPAKVDPAPDVAPTPEPEPPFTPIELTEDQRTKARRVQPLVAAAARDHGLDPNLINAIIWNESKFNPRARNRSGARGLMQLMPGTAKAMARRLRRPSRPYDPEFSVQAGAALLSILLAKFDGDLDLALFAYTRGDGRVRGWLAAGETEMPKGVVAFIERVRRAMRTFAALGFPGSPEAPAG
ncbi:MAG: transglycosylase SLT domain-containing protein [Myxococcales bacterium]|nr:transglycosylase SLT domain-containing protein [Myxococcales bacterium]